MKKNPYFSSSRLIKLKQRKCGVRQPVITMIDDRCRKRFFFLRSFEITKQLLTKYQLDFHEVSPNFTHSQNRDF